MLRRVFCALAIAVSLVSVARADDCNQSYGEWMQRMSKDGVYYVCRYRFEPQPGVTVSNFVIWIPTADDAPYFYYSNPKGQIWCRNANEFHKEHKSAEPRWQVIAEAENKKNTLSQIPVNAWGELTHPICPGSDQNGRTGCPMRKPPRAPLEEYNRFQAAANKRQANPRPVR